MHEVITEEDENSYYDAMRIEDAFFYELGSQAAIQFIYQPDDEPIGFLYRVAHMNDHFCEGCEDKDVILRVAHVVNRGALVPTEWCDACIAVMPDDERNRYFPKEG